MQLAAPVGQLVERAAGAALLHDAAGLQLAEALRQHVRARAQADPQIAEALRPEQQLAHDQQGPALTDDVERAGDAAGISVAAKAAHEVDLVACKQG